MGEVGPAGVVYVCKHCGYDLSGLTTGERVTCPECGAEYDPSVMHPFPTFFECVIAYSRDWVRGLAVMVSISLVLALIARWAPLLVFLVSLVILAVGLIVISFKSWNRVLRVEKFSFEIPRYARRMYGVLTFGWCLVYWLVVSVPWLWVL